MAEFLREGFKSWKTVKNCMPVTTTPEEGWFIKEFVEKIHKDNVTHKDKKLELQTLE